MTATERLRQLLDERGVEWTANNGEHVKETCWPYMGELTAAFAEYDNGTTRFACDTWCFTPEQAVDATLGRGTCKLEQHGSLADQPSMVCWSCSECGFGWHHSIYDKQFSYCPNCGRKVEP